MITVRMLGSTAVEDGVRLTGAQIGGNKPRQVLELLALHLGQPMSKDRLIDSLWEDHPPAGCVATLESYVCLLRRRIGRLDSARDAVVTSHRGYLLDPERARVDVDDVRRLLDGDPGHVTSALGRITGELLADEPRAVWAEEARTGFDRMLAESCTCAARAANRAGDHLVAERLATEAAVHDSYSEPALRELMHARAGAGDRAGALHAYDVMRERMAGELGLDPDPETRALFVSLLQQGHASAEVCDRAEVSTLVGLLRRALEVDPQVLAGVPGSIELARALRPLTPTG